MLCSSDDEDQSPEIPDAGFISVTLDLSTVTINDTDTSFEIDGFQFINFQGSTSTNGVVEGIQLARADENGNPSFIELNLEGVEGVSQITVSAINNATTMSVALRNNSVTVTEQNVASGVNVVRDLVFDVRDQSFNALRITAFEGFALSIRLE